MAEKKEGYTDKMVRLPDETWAKLKREAVRCRRTLPRQMEAIIEKYFGAQVDLWGFSDHSTIAAELDDVVPIHTNEKKKQSAS